MVDNRVGLVITNTPLNHWYAPLVSEPKVIGRGGDVPHKVPKGHRSVSRNHAKLWRDHRGAWICDLNSTYGTWVNGVRLVPQRETKIAHGDRILLGTLELTVLDEQEIFNNVLLDEPGSSDSSSDTFKLSNAVDSDVAEAHQAFSTLSNAERDVVLWMSRGYTSPDEIGAALHRSPNTIRTQLNSIFQKLSVHSRDELIGLLLRHKGSASSETI